MCEKKKQNIEAEERLLNFRPFLFVALFLCLGIYFGYLYKIKDISAWWIVVPMFPLGVSFFFCKSFKRLKRRLMATLSLVIALFVGIAGFIIQINDYTSTPFYNGEYTVTGIVSDYADGKYSVRVEIDDIQISGSKEEGKLIAYLPATYSGKIHLSDTLRLRGIIQTQTELSDKNGFRAQAINDDIRFEMEAEATEITGRVFNPFTIARERIRKVLYKGMDEQYASVCFAVLTGNVSGIESELLQNVRYGGIAHIFAVSGLHIGALYAFCLLIINKTKCKNTPKFVRFLLVAFVLIVYGGVCGYSASVIRATAMCLIFYASKLVGYGSDNLERIGASVPVVLFLSPISLFGIGFQLSYLACFGITLLSRPIRGVCMRLCAILRLYPKQRSENAPPGIRERVVSHIASFLGVTLSAQIATLPVSYVYFGYVSVWSLLLNCLYVPMVTAIFPVQLLFTLTACILPTSASAVILFPLKGMWAVMVLLFELVEFSPLRISNLTVSGGALLCYYLTLVLFSDKFNLNKIEKWVLRIFGALSFVLCLTLASL